LATAAVILVVAIRYGGVLSKALGHKSDEVILLSTFGLVLLVAGVAQRLQVSAAVGAFLVGIALSGPLARQAHRLLGPLRDLFARGGFSIVVAGLGVSAGLDPRLGPLSAAYVLLLAVLGPILARVVAARFPPETGQAV